MNESAEGKVLLERRSIIWPVIIFPYHERSHTVSVIGWKDNRPRILKDVKASFAGRVWLTEGYLRACSFLLSSLVRISIPLESIVNVKISNRDIGLVEVRYRQAHISRLLHHLTWGAPREVILLKLDDVAGKWIQAISERIG